MYILLNYQMKFVPNVKMIKLKIFAQKWPRTRNYHIRPVC